MKLATSRSILIELTIKVFPNFFWEIFAFLKQLGAGKPYLECFPLLLTAEKLEMFLKQMKDSKFCFRIKRAAKLHFMYYSRMVIGLLRTGLYKSAFLVHILLEN